jgi:hypothetical protein
MAREAGFEQVDQDVDEWICFTDEIERFEALVRADEREEGQKWFDAVTAQHKQLILAEREACAKVCETHAPTTTPTWVSYAAAIRARGETK